MLPCKSFSPVILGHTDFNKSNILSYKRPEKSLEAIYLTIWKKDQVDIHDHGLHATFIVVSFNLVAQSQNNVNIFKLNNKDHRAGGPPIVEDSKIKQTKR